MVDRKLARRPGASQTKQGGTVGFGTNPKVRVEAERIGPASCPGRHPVRGQVLGDERPLPDPLDAHHETLVRVGAGDEVVALEPVLVRELPHLRREERERGLEGVEAEMTAVGDTQAARLRYLEPVPDLHPAHRASFDPLDGHPQVEQLHVCHRCTASVVKPSATAGTSPSLRTVCAWEEGQTAHSEASSA